MKDIPLSSIDINRQKSRQSIITSFEFKLKLIENQVALATNSCTSSAIISDAVKTNLNILRSSFSHLLEGKIGESEFYGSLAGARHAILTITEQSLKGGEQWPLLRRDLLRAFGRNGIEAEIAQSSIHSKFGKGV